MVANRRSGEIYLEGELARGIVPEESVWMHGQGSGEDGFLLLLRKMNLELLRRCPKLTSLRCTADRWSTCKPHAALCFAILMPIALRQYHNGYTSYGYMVGLTPHDCDKSLADHCACHCIAQSELPSLLSDFCGRTRKSLKELSQSVLLKICMRMGWVQALDAQRDVVAAPV